jgi:hypothetical protein
VDRAHNRASCGIKLSRENYLYDRRSFCCPLHRLLVSLLLRPIVDQWTNEFLRGRFGATADSVLAAMRCEGFANLTEFYAKTGLQTHYSGTPKTKQIQPIGKNGRAPGAAYPDWCIRFPGPGGALRLVGEAKYSSGRKTRNALVAELRHDLIFDLKIKADAGTDWGHDFGYGIGYSAGGEGRLRAELVEDYWESQRILMSVFWPAV